MVKTNTLLIGGGIILGAILILKSKSGVSVAGEIGKATGRAAGETVGGVVTGTARGLVETIYPYSLYSLPERGYKWVKSWGNPNKFWS